MSAAVVLSVVSSIVSIILGMFAICLSIYFFVQGKGMEKNTAASLAKIETQADALQKLSNRYLDRLTRYVTEERPRHSDESITQLISIVAQIPERMTASLTHASVKDSTDQLVKEIYSCYIALYFYIAQANYWSQAFLPDASNFNESDQFHTLIRRIVDISQADFTAIAGLLANCDQDKLRQNSLSHLLTETEQQWRFSVRSTAQVFIQREQNVQG